jgi:hypothetical protein
MPVAERKSVYRTQAISTFTSKTIYNTRARSAIGKKYSDLIGSKLTPAHIAFNLTMVSLFKRL